LKYRKYCVKKTMKSCGQSSDVFIHFKERDVFLDQKKMSSPKIIKSRFRMMGEGTIPKNEIENLKEEHLKIFLTESDPKKWPPNLAHLKKYVPENSVA